MPPRDRPQTPAGGGFRPGEQPRSESLAQGAKVGGLERPPAASAAGNHRQAVPLELRKFWISRSRCSHGCVRKPLCANPSIGRNSGERPKCELVAIRCLYMMRELCNALNRVMRVRFGVGVPEDDHVTIKIHIRGQPRNSFPDTRCFQGKDRNFPPAPFSWGGHGISHDGSCVRFDRRSEAGEELFVVSPGIPLFGPQRFCGPLT